MVKPIQVKEGKMCDSADNVEKNPLGNNCMHHAVISDCSAESNQETTQLNEYSKSVQIKYGS